VIAPVEIRGLVPDPKGLGDGTCGDDEGKNWMINALDPPSYILRYVGKSELPPAYPTVVLKTPRVAPYRDSAPQKQPMPKVAVALGIFTS